MSAALEALKLAQDALVVFRAGCVAGSAGEQLADEALAKVKVALAAHKPHQTCPNEACRLLGECCNPKRAAVRLTEEQWKTHIKAFMYLEAPAFLRSIESTVLAANGLGGE